LPVGVSFIGGRWSEPTLIGLAYALEQTIHVRVPPTFIASTSSAAAAATRGAAANVERRAVVPSRGGRRKMPSLR